MVIVENIEKFCGNQGITVKEFERRCKLGNSTVGKWRRGLASPSVKTLQKISEVTEVPIENWIKEHGVV